MDNTHKAQCNECKYTYNQIALETLLQNAINHYWESCHTVTIYLSDGDLLGYLDSDSCGTLDQLARPPIPSLTELDLK